MKSSKRNGQSNQTKKVSGSRAFQIPDGNGGSKEKKQSRDRNGETCLDQNACQENGFATLRGNRGGACRHQPGNGGLDTGNSNAAGKNIDRKNQLIKSHAFCTNCPGKEYPIEETHKTAQNAGKS